ncbi:MAG: cytochrome c maturation protein CcmE [Acidimicrobiales bacterium]
MSQPLPQATPAAPPAPGRSTLGRGRLLVVVLVIAVAIGFLMWKGLGDATVYFKTADEAVRDRSSLGDRRFRVEGLVVDPVTQSGGAVRFSIISAGVRVAVEHRGDPPELFRAGIPVVLEGHWDGDLYASDRIMVKHTTEYREKNPDRVDQYVGDSSDPSTGSG